MRYNHELRVLSCFQNQTGKRRKKVWVKAGFRLVEHHQFRRTWREQCRRQKEKPQCPIGQFGRRQRSENPMLLKLQFESPTVVVNHDMAAGEGVIDCSG